MKTYLYSTFLTLALCLTACTDRTIHRSPEMEIADRIMISQPDSARKLLVRIKNDIKNENTATKMYYDLLLTHAEEKCNIPQTSDSTMQKVVSYYEKHGTKEQLIQAYYLLGRAYDNMEFKSSALNFYNKTLNIRLRDNERTYRLRALANEKIGLIMIYQNLFYKAMPYSRKAYQYACLAKDTDLIAFSLRDIGKCYASLKYPSKASNYYEKGVEFAQRIGNNTTYKTILRELASHYINNKEYEKAKKAIRDLWSNDKIQILGKDYVLMGKIYDETNQTDSAIYYYKKCLTMGNDYDRQDAAQSLYFISSKKGDYKQAGDYGVKLTICTDSIKNMEMKYNQDLIQSLSKKLEIEKENTQLRVQDANSRFFILTFIALVFIIVIATALTIKNRIRKSKEQKKLLMNTMEELREHSLTAKMENEKEIADMKAQLETLGKEKEAEMQTKILKVKTDMLQKWNDMIDSRREEQELLELELQNSDIYQFFHHNITKTPADNDFTELKKAVDKAYHNFTKRLADLYPDIKEKEIRTCLLVKINLSPTDICNILNISNSGVSMIRSRLYKKIFNKEGSSEEFDRFIKDL